MKDIYIIEVYIPWCFVYSTYFSNTSHDDLSPPPHLPLTVILENGQDRLAPVLISKLIIDVQQKIITVITDNLGEITVNKNNPWRIRVGKTKDGRSVVTTNLE